MDNVWFWEDLSGRSWPLAGIPDRSGITISWQEAVESFPLICVYLPHSSSSVTRMDFFEAFVMLVVVNEGIQKTGVRIQNERALN